MEVAFLLPPKLLVPNHLLPCVMLSADKKIVKEYIDVNKVPKMFYITEKKKI